MRELKTIVVDVKHDLDVDGGEIDLTRFIRKLQDIKRQATKDGLRKIKIKFDAGYENIEIDVSGTKRVELTAAEQKAKELKQIKKQLRAKLQQEIREKREEYTKAVKEFCNRK